MKLYRVLFLPLLLFLILCPYANALTVSFADQSMVKDKGFEVYQIMQNQTIDIGPLNTTATAVDLDPNSSYLFVFTPSSTDYFSDPYMIPGAIIANLETHYIDYLWIAVLLILLALVWVTI